MKLLVTEAPNAPGHDLTYQAAAGVLASPQVPRVPWADLIGGYQATIAALDALREREQAQANGNNVVVHRRIGLKQGVDEAAEAFRIGATAPGEILSGAHPQYAIYKTQDGWIAVAALEPHFHTRLTAREFCDTGRAPRQIFNRRMAGICQPTRSAIFCRGRQLAHCQLRLKRRRRYEGNTMRILIVGAGIAGPTLAYWLHQDGHEVTLLEASPQLRKGGYLVDFWGAGFDVAERMGIVPRLMRDGYVIKEQREVSATGNIVDLVDPAKC